MALRRQPHPVDVAAKKAAVATDLFTSAKVALDEANDLLTFSIEDDQAEITERNERITAAHQQRERNERVASRLAEFLA